MKQALIITDDIVKVQLLTGLIGKVYSRLSWFWLKITLGLTVWFWKFFYQVSVLTSGCFKFKGARVFEYSRELARLDYAGNRLEYWQETDKILQKLKLKPSHSRIFSTRLCIYLAYNYYIYASVEKKIIADLRPDKIVRFTGWGWSRINRRLFTWLLDREYRKKFDLFLYQSRKPPRPLKRRGRVMLLSLDFYRHLKVLMPLYLKLKSKGNCPLFITDIKNPTTALGNYRVKGGYLFLASFLPSAPDLAKEYSVEANKLLCKFNQPYRPLIFYSLILSRLYLQAARNLFSELKPKQLIVASDLRYLENSLAAVARENQVASLLVSPNVLLDLAEVNRFDTTNIIALPGQYVKNQLIRHGLPASRLKVTGDLQSVNQAKFTKKQVFERLGIKDLNKKLILLISFRPNWLIPLAEKRTFVVWSSLAVKEIKDAVLVVKPHPTEKRYRVIDELKLWGITNARVVDNQKLELVDLLSVASVVVQTWSMTIFEAIAMSRPVISVNPFSKDYKKFLPMIAGGAIEVNDQSDLIRWLKILINPRHSKTQRQLIAARQASRRFLRKSDGRAVDRTVKLIA